MDRLPQGVGLCGPIGANADPHHKPIWVWSDHKPLDFHWRLVDFDYIFSYAPYNNIKKMDYPHILITTSLSDNRVLFDEPAKFTAKLREYKTDNNLLLLKTEMNAGHGGKSGRDGAIEEIAIDYAFALKISKKI